MHNKSADGTEDTDTSRLTKPGVALALLVLVYTFNFVDRQIIGILAIPIKADLGLSDTELGLMGGLAFAMFYTTLGIPVALLADRVSRTWIMTVALSLWSLMTALSGLAQNFWQLFAARLGVGVGEAGGTAPAYSLIADYFPPHQRARALAIYSFGIPIGSSFGIVFGGVIATYLDWRVAFFIIGLAGIGLAPIFRLIVKEPPRGQYDRSVAPPSPATLGDVMKVLMGKPSFWAMTAAASFSSMMTYGLYFWLPSFLNRSFDLPLLDASIIYGGMILVGGIAGMWFGGVMADRVGTGNKAGYVRAPAIALLVSLPFCLVGILAPSLLIAIPALLVPTAAGLVWAGPVTSAIQHMVPPHMRATASAIFLFANNLVGIGLGTSLLGFLSDTLAAEYGADSLRYSILAATIFYLAAALFLFLAGRTLDADWLDEGGEAAS